MRIGFSAKAARQFEKIERKWQIQIRAKLTAYAESPSSVAGSVTRLVEDGRLRMRVGDYRIVFTEDGIVLTVDEVAHRREIYRRL